MSVVSGNKIPIYTQIAQTIKQRVRTGQYRAGEVLPSIRTIGKEFGVSVKAVHQAMRTLEESGVIQSHPGKGIVIAAEDQCQRTAIIFGVIHPYSEMGFQRDVLEFVDEAFAERSNFVIVRSSKDDPARERDIAAHLIVNGVRGLLVWPTANDPNGMFFQELSTQVPVVLIDRKLAGVDIPCVTLDYQACGRTVAEEMLGTMQKKRLLVLIDNLPISPYRDLIDGVQSAAGQMGRLADVTVVQHPISSVIRQLSRCDFSSVADVSQAIRRMISDGGYDAVFCTQNDFIEHVIAQTGIMNDLPNVQVGTFWNSDLNVRSAYYLKLNCLEWCSNSTGMIAHAADLIQRWVLTRQMPRDNIFVPMNCLGRCADTHKTSQIGQ